MLRADPPIMLDRVWLRTRSCLSLITSRNQIKVHGSGTTCWRNWSLIILLHKWKHLWLQVLLRLKLHRNQPIPFSKNDWCLCPILLSGALGSKERQLVRCLELEVVSLLFLCPLMRAGTVPSSHRTKVSCRSSSQILGAQHWNLF